jgi:glycosyltransferase involved in cell wall biosynthesis
MLRVLMAAGVPKRREAGAAMIIYQLAERYRAWGNEVDCLFLEDLGGYENVPARFMDVVYAWRLAQYVRRSGKKYSVLNLHAPWGCAHTWRRRVVGPAALPPYVLTLQGAEEQMVQAMRREAAKGRAAHFQWKNRMWHWAYHRQMYRQAFRGADYAIVANREAAAALQLLHGLEPERVWFIPNGVDEGFFLPRTAASEGLRVLFVGTWLDRKGVHYLRDAFVELAKANRSVKLTIAGCMVAEGEVRKWFPEEVQARLTVRPAVAAVEMPLVYAEHDVFLFPSLVEGMPLSLLEAMASGMAVVTTDACGMSDVVEDGYNGLLVKPATTKELVQAVTRVMQDKELRETLGRRATDTARRYTWDLVGARYLSVLELAARSGR